MKTRLAYVSGYKIKQRTPYLKYVLFAVGILLLAGIIIVLRATR